MRVLIGYDGSESAETVLDDLQKAGLPRESKALIVSVGEVVMPPLLAGSEVAGMPVTPQSVKIALAQTAQSLKEAEEVAGKAGARLRSYFPTWGSGDRGPHWLARSRVDTAGGRVERRSGCCRFARALCSWEIYPGQRVEESGH